MLSDVRHECLPSSYTEAGDTATGASIGGRASWLTGQLATTQAVYIHKMGLLVDGVLPRRTPGHVRVDSLHSYCSCFRGGSCLYW